MENPFFELKPDFIYMPPFQPLVFGEYKPKENFPNCCPYHKQVMREAQKLVNRFPNCCDRHREMVKYSFVNIENYKSNEFAESIIMRVSYTNHHISERIGQSNWYKDITDYIEYILLSFGTPSFGDHVYQWAVLSNIESQQDIIGHNKAQQLTDYINGLYQKLPSEPIAEEVDLNELYRIYQKWLSIFPFTVQPFDKLKDRFTNIFPVMSEEPVYNPYTGLSKFRVITKGKLIEWLIDKTKEILKSANSIKLVHDEFTTNKKTHQVDLISEKHKVRQTALLNEFSKDEKQYFKIIEKWLSYEIDYFKKVTPFLTDKKNRIEQIENKHFCTTDQTITPTSNTDLTPMNYMEDLRSLFLKSDDPFVWREIAFQHNTGRGYKHKQDLIAIFGNNFNLVVRPRVESFWERNHYVNYEQLEDIIYQFREHFPVSGRIDGVNYFDDLIQMIVDKYKRMELKNSVDNVSSRLASAESDNLIERNIFNKMPLQATINYFMQLVSATNKNGEPFLIVTQVQQFVERAFVGDTNISILTINATNRDKGRLIGLFHLFYTHCSTHQSKKGKIDPSATAEKYTRLLTDHFDNWIFDEVKNNFRSGGNWKRPA